jgi:hypothetical protein
MTNKITDHPAEIDEGGVNFKVVRYIVRAGSNPEDDYEMYSIVPDDWTNDFIVGQWGDLLKVYDALKTVIELGKAELVDELDPRLGHPWMYLQEAAEYAKCCGIKITPRAIQYACERGEIRLANKDSGRWQMPQRSLASWLDNRPKPGPKKK